VPHRPSQYGTECGLWIDLHPADSDPAPGDVWATEAGSYYLLRTARRVRSRVARNRWRVRCIRLDPADVTPSDVTVNLCWYPRNRR
jgi:hypothetical protein